MGICVCTIYEAEKEIQFKNTFIAYNGDNTPVVNNNKQIYSLNRDHYANKDKNKGKDKDKDKDKDDLSKAETNLSNSQNHIFKSLRNPFSNKVYFHLIKTFKEPQQEPQPLPNTSNTSNKSNHFPPPSHFTEDTVSHKNKPTDLIGDTLKYNTSDDRFNHRLILPILYINSIISNKLHLNKEEILWSYSILQNLDFKSDVIYECVLDYFEANSKKTIYTKIYRTCQRWFICGDHTMKGCRVWGEVPHNTIVSINKLQVDKRVKSKVWFDLVCLDKTLRFGSDDVQVGKSIVKCLEIMCLFNTN